jgi:ABC-2 type transport system ATP-binding protein
MAERNGQVVQTVGLTKVYKDFWNRAKVVAVDGLDLDILPHEIFGLLGPNGSGKTTTIKMLLGLLYPTRGVAQVFGRSPLDVKTHNRIGYLPEESYLYRFLSARETLDYYGRLFGQSRPLRRKRTDALLEMVGLDKVGDRPVGQFSKGMARRIGLAQSLINDPDLLILDEPTTGLDPLGSRQIKDLIIELGKRGKTIILCSHLLSEVEDVCTRVCILYGGRERATGPIDELLARQEMTQITAPRLSPELIDRVKSLIVQESQTDEVNVSSPTDRLEDFFLRIVREAQKQRVATSGAASDGKIADFLSAASPDAAGKQVIDQLVKASSPAPAENIESVPRSRLPSETQVKQEVVNDLIQPSEDERDREPPERSTAPDEAPSSSEKAKDDAVDRQVIDDLIDKNKQ